EDPQATVLVWDVRRADLPRLSDEPKLRIRADGTASIHDPYGPGKPIQTQLTAAELQQLLQFAIYEQGFFRLDQRRLIGLIQSARWQRGSTKAESGLPTTMLRIHADEHEHEVICAAPRRYADHSVELQPLAKLETRLEQLVTWAYAGG